MAVEIDMDKDEILNDIEDRLSKLEQERDEDGLGKEKMIAAFFEAAGIYFTEEYYRRNPEARKPIDVSGVCCECGDGDAYLLCEDCSDCVNCHEDLV